MEKIILDTDFLITAIKYKIDLFSELNRLCDFKKEVFIVDKTVEELKNKPQEKLIREIIREKHIKVIKTENNKNVDDLLLELEKTIVCTQDLELKKKIKKQGRKVITIRQKKYLIYG